MKIVTNFNSYKKKSKTPIFLAIGNFDGVHLGHKKLIEYVIGQAKKFKGKAAIFTFKEHPQRVLHSSHKSFLISSSEQKLFILNKLGLDLCFIKEFSASFSKIEAEDFVKNVLVKKLNVREVCMGRNARFGHNRSGNTKTMRFLSKKYVFIFKEMKPVFLNKKTVSSSMIRKLILSGKLDIAKKCLGRSFSLFADVIGGDKRGKTLGFSTANLKIKNEILPPEGVYAVSIRVLYRGKNIWRKGIINIGFRPTFYSRAEGKPSIEVHIFDFDRNIYGKTIEVIFHRFIRKERKFKRVKMLQFQIEKDIKIARKHFRANKN